MGLLSGAASLFSSPEGAGLGAAAINPVMAMSTGNNIANTVINWKNYKLQQKNLQYQKRLQSNIFRREDTAVQRRVKDLVAAGLSPTLAAGSSAGAGQAINTTAPQMNETPDFAQMALNLMQMDKDFAVKDQQIKLMKYQGQAAQSAKKKNDAQTSLIDWDTNMYKELGIPSTASSNTKDLSTAIKLYRELRAKALGEDDSVDYDSKGRLKKRTNPGNAGSW